MLNEDIYALILKKVIDLEQSQFDFVKNWKSEAVKEQALGEFQLNDKWPSSAKYQEKLILHTKIIYNGTNIWFMTLGDAKKYFNRWKVVAKFENAYLLV